MATLREKADCTKERDDLRLYVELLLTFAITNGQKLHVIPESGSHTVSICDFVHKKFKSYLSSKLVKTLQKPFYIHSAAWKPDGK